MAGTEKKLSKADLNLLNVIETGNVRKVKRALRGGLFRNPVNIDAWHPETGDTPLIKAAKLNHPEIVSFLIDNGANVLIEDLKHHTVLWHCLENNQIDNVGRLIDLGVKEIVFTGRQTLMTRAAKLKLPDMIGMLVKKGIAVDERDSFGKSAVCYAVENGDMEMVRLLDKYGIDYSTVYDCNDGKFFGQDYFGRTLAHLACCKTDDSKSVEILQFLEEKGVDINQPDKNGNTPLMVAVASNYTELAAYLIKKGADVNAQNDAGKTALMSVQTVEMAELLLKHGADIHMRDKNNRNVLFADNLSKDVLSYLLKNGAIDDINEQDKDGNTPLLKRCLNEEDMHILLQNGADTDIQNNDGNTVVTIVCEDDASDRCVIIGSTYRLKSILPYHPDLNIQNNKGETALIRVAKKLYPETIRVLLEAGALCDIRDNDGYTAADYFENPTLAQPNITYLSSNDELIMQMRVNEVNERNAMDNPYSFANADGKNPVENMDRIYSEKRLKHLIEKTSNEDLMQLPEKDAVIVSRLAITGLVLDALQKLSYKQAITFYGAARKDMSAEIQQRAEQLIREKRINKDR